MAEITVRRIPMIWEPWYPTTWLDEIERWAGHTWETWKPDYQSGLTPRTDIYEYKDELVIRLEYPGVRKEDIDISLEGDYLTVKTEKKPETYPEGTVWYRNERWYGKHLWTYTLPYPVSADKITAKLEHGMLEILLPKAEEVRAKKIDVTVK